jgi:pimeloyl-ACP methyl ester carboxylesterase
LTATRDGPYNETMGRLFTCVSMLSVCACGGGGGSTPDAAPPPADAAPPQITLLQPCTDTMAGIYADVSGLPPFDASHRGDVFRCARDRWMDAATVDKAMHAQGFVGPAATSGTTVYRIAFRTERAQVGPDVREGLSSALLFVPDHPRAPGALIDYAHPSVGIADSCAPSLADVGASSGGMGSDIVRAPELGFAGAGFTVIAPDFAGFGYGEPPGYDDAEDEAKSVLDATRAAAKILPPDLLPGKVVIVGHSMGGHAALAAHAMLPTYGATGDVVAVVGLAPFWISNYAWGALMMDGLGYDTTNAAYLYEYQLDYFYGHGELLDGPGHGLDLVQPAKQAQVKTIMTTECIDQVATDMKTLGAGASDYFTADAVNGLAPCGLNGDCSTAPATTWAPRFSADRPAIAKDGPPILIWYGAKDTTISPAYAQCELDTMGTNIAGGTTTITTCSDPDAVHIAVPARNTAWVTTWIDAILAGTTPPSCTAPAKSTCPGLPPNL